MSLPHDHLPTIEHRKMWDSNSKMYEKPQEDDCTYLDSEFEKIIKIKPVGARVLVELLDDDGSISKIIRPFHFIKVMRSRVLTVGEGVYHKIKPGVELVHQHRCGFQIGFHGLHRTLRIIPERLIMGVL